MIAPLFIIPIITLVCISFFVLINKINFLISTFKIYDNNKTNITKSLTLFSLTVSLSYEIYL
jgi:hypothetical protein